MQWLITPIDFPVYFCKISLFPWLLNWNYCQLLKRQGKYYVNCWLVALLLDKFTSVAIWCFLQSGINVLPGGNGNELNFTCTEETGQQGCLALWSLSVIRCFISKNPVCQVPPNKLDLLTQVVTSRSDNELHYWWLLKEPQKSRADDLSLDTGLHRQWESDMAFNSVPLMVIFGCLPDLPGATKNITFALFRLIVSLYSGAKFEKWLTAGYMFSGREMTFQFIVITTQSLRTGLPPKTLVEAGHLMRLESSGRSSNPSPSRCSPFSLHHWPSLCGKSCMA